MDKCFKFNRLKYNTTFAINDLFFIIALILFLLADFVQYPFFEILWLFSVIFLIVLNHKTFKHYHNEKLIKTIKLFFILILFLFVLHLIVSPLKPENIIRFYGLTKCTLIPCIMFYCFYKNNKLIYLWKIIIPFLICLNIAFFYAHIINKNSYIEGFGSVNVIGGINIIVLPFVLYRTAKSYKSIEKIFNIILILLIATNAILFDATTYKYLFYAFIILLILSLIFKSDKAKKIYCSVVAFAVLIFVILSIVLVITKILSNDFFLYQNRYVIWEYGYNQFGELPIIEQIFGSGNNFVRMQSKSLEAHNITMDVLMIYGWAGVAVLCILFLELVKYRKKIKISTRCVFMTTLLIYTIICFMNPFFTGVTYFQIISWAALLGLINIKDAQMAG